MYPHSDLDIDLDQPANLERNAVSHVDSDGTKKTCIGGEGDPPLPWEKGNCVGRVLGISGVRSTVSALLARWQHNITYSSNQNCQTAGVHENKTIFRPSSIKVNKHNRTF